MALFTSWRAMKSAVETLRDRLDVPVLAQGELPKPALLDQFSADPATCLFATLSFWEGVDVPGESLSVVVIDKLPFAAPDAPSPRGRPR
jgi:ATP-dependent DNA helicase DinG